MRSKSFLIIFSLVTLPAMGLAWNSQNTHQPLTTRSIELLSNDYKDIKVNFSDRIVSGTGNSNLLLALVLERDSHGNPTLNGGNPKDIWEKRVFEPYKSLHFSNAYYALGNIIHLTQDQAVPPHGANVSHGLGDNFESDASGITNVIQMRGAVSGTMSVPYGYYTAILNGTWMGCENWRSIVSKEVNNNTIPSGTRFWVRNSAPGAADWGRYGGPGDNDFFDDITAGDLIRGRFDEAVTQVTGVLMSASMALPPLISTFSITSGDVNGPAGAQISFTVMENRLPDVKIDLYVQETSQPIITNGLIKLLPSNQSDNGREYYDYSPDAVTWTAKDLSLYPTLSSDLELLPQMAQFQLTWSGEVEGAPLTPRAEPYTLAMRVTDHDGNTDKYTHQFIVRPDVTPPTVWWTSTDIYGTQVPHQVTGANTLETAPWFHIGYDTGTYISFQFQDAGTGVGNFSIYPPSAGEGPGAPLFSAAFRNGQSFLLSDFTLQNDAAGYLLAATDALGNATTVYFHLDRQHPEIQISMLWEPCPRFSKTG